MNDLQTKQAIASAIRQFQRQPLDEAASKLFETLGYTSNKRLKLTPNSVDKFVATFAQGKSLNDKYALQSQWKSIDFLFQLTDDEIRSSGNQAFSFVSDGAYNGAIINSYLFVAIELNGNYYSRT